MVLQRTTRNINQVSGIHIINSFIQETPSKMTHHLKLHLLFNDFSVDRNLPTTYLLVLALPIFDATEELSILCEMVPYYNLAWKDYSGVIT